MLFHSVANLTKYSLFSKSASAALRCDPLNALLHPSPCPAVTLLMPVCDPLERCKVWDTTPCRMTAVTLHGVVSPSLMPYCNPVNILLRPSERCSATLLMPIRCGRWRGRTRTTALYGKGSEPDENAGDTCALRFGIIFKMPLYSGGAHDLEGIIDRQPHARGGMAGVGTNANDGCTYPLPSGKGTTYKGMKAFT